MGLSLIAGAPDMDQQLKLFNQLNAFQHVSPGQWVGESHLNGLGLGDGQPNEGLQIFNQVVDKGLDTYRQIQELKHNKNKHPSAPPPAHNPAPVSQNMSTGGSGGGLPGWLVWGGGLLVVAILLYVVMKKKKKGRDDDAPSHDEKGA